MTLPSSISSLPLPEGRAGVAAEQSEQYISVFPVPALDLVPH